MEEHRGVRVAPLERIYPKNDKRFRRHDSTRGDYIDT